MDACGGCSSGLQPDDRFCATCGRPRARTARPTEPEGRPALAGPPAGPAVPPYGWAPQPAFHPAGPASPVVPDAPHPLAPPATAAIAAAATNQMAIVALVVALVGIPLCLLSPVAIPFGHVALGQIRRSADTDGRLQPGMAAPAPTPQGGRGLAIAGLVIGYTALAFWVIALVQVASASGR